MNNIILNNDSIKRLNNFLNLPASGREQDWDVELANPNRIDEFLTLYNSENLKEDDLTALMALILSSYDEYLYNNDKNYIYEERIRKYLIKDKDIHQNLIDYWSLDNEYLDENYFKITLFIREIRNNLTKT